MLWLIIFSCSTPPTFAEKEALARTCREEDRVEDCLQLARIAPDGPQKVAALDEACDLGDMPSCSEVLALGAVHGPTLAFWSAYYSCFDRQRRDACEFLLGTDDLDPRIETRARAELDRMQ